MKRLAAVAICGGLVLAGAGAGGLLAAGAEEAKPPFAPVSKVHDLMGVNGEYSKSLKKELDQENPNYQTVGELARVMAEVANVIRYHKPTSETTWWNAATTVKRFGLELAAAAESNDADGVQAALGQMGAGCKSCHDVYRKDD